MTKLPAKWWQWLLMYPTLAVAIIGAIPQYQNWWQAYKLKVPARSVSQATEQIDLWNKNYECSKKENPYTVKTCRNELIQTTVCPSGDILVKVQTPDKPTPDYRWIGFNTFRDTNAVAFDPFVKEAYADETGKGINLFAQNETILCQYRDANGFIVRRIRLSNGRCQEEVINPYTGATTIRPAPCTPCPSQTRS
jgi:hypothetical protein